MASSNSVLYWLANYIDKYNIPNNSYKVTPEFYIEKYQHSSSINLNKLLTIYKQNI